MMDPGDEYGYLHKARLWIRRLGLDVRRYPDLGDPPYRMSRLFSRHGISVVFDVGAYVGDFTSSLRAFGYSGWVVSFEPQAEAYRLLKQRSAKDPKWVTRRTAVGSTEGSAYLNVSRNRHSSSLLSIDARHLSADPTAHFTGEEQVPIATLDALIKQEDLPGGRETFLKIDVQGYEDEVLAGASETLPQLRGVQIECTLQPVYERGMQLRRALDYFYELGFALAGIEPGFTDKATGETLQLDCIFFRP